MRTLRSEMDNNRLGLYRTVKSKPRFWAWTVAFMVTVFYVANVYDRALSGQLYYLKWASLMPVIAISCYIIQSKKYGSTPRLNAWPLMLISLSAFASVFVAADMLASSVVLISIVLAFTTAFLIASVILKTGSLNLFMDAISLVGRGVIFSSAVFYALGLNLGRSSEFRFSGWTDNPNTLALLLAPTIVILLAQVIERRRGWLFWSFPFLLAGMFLLIQTGSRSGILWIIASLGGFYAFRQGIGISLIAAFFVLLISVPYWDVAIDFALSLVQRKGLQATTDNLSGRSEVWELGLELFRERPAFGYGTGTSQDLISNYEWMFVEHQGGHFHSSFMTVAVEMGSFGLLAVLIMIAITAIAAMKLSSRMRSSRDPEWAFQALPLALFVGALAHGLFETTLMSAGNANMILIWICMLLIQGSVSMKSQMQSPAR